MYTPDRCRTTHLIRRASHAAVPSVLQSLESRRLLASINVTAGELVVAGDASKANAISIDLSSNSRNYNVAAGSVTQSVSTTGIFGLRVTGGGLNDSISIGSNVAVDSVIHPGAGNDTVNGGGGSDNVFDTSGTNQFFLRGGDDQASGGSGNDTIDGGDGNDIAFGNGGTDRFVGGSGNDTFDGGDGTDSADGGSGTDITLNTESRTSVEYHPGLAPSVPAAAKSILSGGTLTVTGLVSGVNVVNVAAVSGNIVVTSGSTRSTFSAGSVQKIVMVGGGQSDFVNIDASLSVPVSVTGGGGDDTIVSAGGNDTVLGNDGDDRITTHGGADAVFGGTGNDVVDTGSGNDTVAGDSGTDRVDGGAGTDATSNVEYAVATEGTGTTPVPTPTPTPTPNPTPTPTPNPGNNPSATAPTPVISAIATNVTVGQAVFVHGLNSKYGNGGQGTAHFEWNFGDASGDYNTLVGFSAGHIYERAGSYTVTLKLWNERMGFKSTAITINVAPAGRQAIFVSGGGDDSNSGGSSGSPVRTAARAFALARGKSNVDILFEGGDAFSVTNGLLIGGSNIRVASYGSGKATLRWDGGRTGEAVLTVVRGSVGCIVENLVIDSKYKGPDPDRSGIPVGVDLIGNTSAVRNITFLNIGYAIQTNKMPTGVMVQDCESPTTYGLRNYLVWGQGSDFVIVGNKAVNSTNEHPIRIYGVDRLLIAYNDLANPESHSWETSKMALNLQKGNDVYVYGNTLRGPRVQIGPLGGRDALNDKGGRLNDVVFENNKILGTGFEIVHGVSNLYIRNNIFDYAGGDALRVGGYDSTYGRGVNNLNVANNTFINSSSRGRVMSVNGKVGGITLVNNLYRSDNMTMGSYGTSAIWVNGASNMSSFTRVSNNLWPVPNVSQYVATRTPGGTGFVIISTNLNDLANYYNINRWNALAGVDNDFQKDVVISGAYRPTSELALVNSGERNYAGVFGDFYGNARSRDEAWTIGAVQL